MVLHTVFWISAAFVCYVYLGYPALLGLFSRVFRRPVHKRSIEPSVSLLVAACSEVGVIEAKIRNALELDYPPERLEIAVVSDGSTEGTAEIASRLADGQRVRVFHYNEKRGWLAALNETVSCLRGEILVLSDAASMLAPDSLRRLVANFADPEVGAASGACHVRRKDQAEPCLHEDFYWKHEAQLKVREAALGSVLGAHGALYALRRSLYPFPPPGAFDDDSMIPALILQRGYRIAYEPSAIAYQEARETAGFGRRVRIMAGNFQQLREIGPLLWPLRPLPLFFFLSHKAGRALAPFALLLLALSNLLLARHPLYSWLGWSQSAFYAIAGLNAFCKLRPPLLRLPYDFCLTNAAAFLAVPRLLSPRRQVAWKQ